ncbi:hypothetical protein [Zobellia roscoffensis]|uniref:hypothetical protein n=1 Tax=Zobellia roscoffensis TaxID=2779508 RepID=UPI00188B79D1|nr:hypothetical protein [Zobellia roscoffensis]
MKNQTYKTGLLLLLLISFISCDSESNSDSPEEPATELSLSENLVGEWILINYYDDSYFVQDQYGIIEQIVNEETDYGIQFTDNPKEIRTNGFLRYTREKYEIIDGEKITEPAGINFWDGDEGEGLHTGEWKIEDGILITNDVSPQEGIEYSIISSIELSGDNLKLTLDNSQFGSHLTGEITIEYRKK